MTARTITLAAAKRDLDRVLKAAQEGPVSLTDRGRTVAVVTLAQRVPFGCMAGTGHQNVEDIVGIDTSADWGRLGE